MPEIKNQLTVKTVPFMGSELMAAKDEKTGKIYVGVSYVCSGIGLSEYQKDNEVKRVQKDVVLQNGAKNLPVKFDGQVRNIQCIDNEFVPLWLAKITITPNMQAEQPEVADKLVQYQLKAQKVLADAFLHNKKPPLSSAPRLGEINSAARLVRQTLRDANVPPQFIAANIKRLYAQAGVTLMIDGVSVEEKHFDATTIAGRLGILSSSGKPHAQAISAIISMLAVADCEKIKVPFQNATNGHSDVTWQYSESVVDKVVLWLQENGYPTGIQHNNKTLKLVYSKNSGNAA
jgi:hypothetical protein